MPAHYTRRQLAARMYPEQVEKLERLCKAESARRGRAISYNEMLVILVERSYGRMVKRERKADQAA